MKNVYKVTYDIKLDGEWSAPDNPSGWGAADVLANGDAVVACKKLEKNLLKEVFEGENGKKLKVQAVRILKVEQIARDVMV